MSTPPAPPATATTSASTVAATPQPSLAAEVLGIVLPIVLLLAALVAVLHLLRRRHGLLAKDAPLSVVQVLPVGPRERIVVVRTRAGRAFAVGVGGQSVRMLAPLDAADLLVPDSMSTLDTDAKRSR